MNNFAKKTVLIIPVVIAAAALIVLAVNSLSKEDTVITGIVDGTTVDVASKIPGRIDSVYFAEGDYVKKGDIIARIESKEMDAKLEQTRGSMDAAKFKFEMAENGARPEEKEAVEKLYMQSKHQYELAEKTWNRMQNMYNDSLISLQEKDMYEFQYKAAREQMDAAKAKYTMTMKGARFEEIEMAKGIFYQAENGYKEALAYHDELLIKSPISGELQKRIVDPGEIISSGYPVFTMLDLNDQWVVLQLKEDQMSKIKKGNILKGKVPALGNKEFDFEVSYIAPVGDFANWKPTNQKGEFDIRTFEVRLRGKNKIDGLRPGMTVNISF